MAEQTYTDGDVRKREEHLRKVLASITEHAIITLDAAGRITEWNQGAERMFGYSRVEALGQSAEIIFTAEDRAQAAHVKEMQRARAAGRAADERWHVRKDGSQLYVSGVLTLLGDAESDGYVKVASDLTDRQKQEEALRRAHDLLETRVTERTAQLANELRERRNAEERVRRLLARVIHVQEEERRRIARDLHDDIGQKMTVLHLKLDALRRAVASVTHAATQIAEVQQFVRQLDRDLDSFTWELRPAALYDLGLVEALRDLVQKWSRTHGIEAHFEVLGLSTERLRPELEIHLYRIAQEALHNVYKHADAKCAEVVLQKRQGELVLSIEDDGKGFDVESTDPHGRHMGLISMRERAALLNGTLEIERATTGGTTVMVRAPVTTHRDEISPTEGDSQARRS